MKKILSLIIILISVSITPITAKAESYEEYCARWLAKQQADDDKFMDELEAEGTLTQEAIDSISKGTSKRKPSTKNGSTTTKKSESNTKSNYNSNSYSNYNKGWIYSTDELHVIGLPEDSETGYTKSGWYGNPE